MNIYIYHLYTCCRFQLHDLYIQKMELTENRNGKLPFVFCERKTEGCVFLGRQTVNGNLRLRFQQTCSSMVICTYSAFRLTLPLLREICCCCCNSCRCTTCCNEAAVAARLLEGKASFAPAKPLSSAFPCPIGQSCGAFSFESGR
jgi:hypothetical protein